MPTLDIPASWERSAEAIVRNSWRTIFVVGEMDRGKSTYCGFLAARLGARGGVAIIDADVGQKDIGPPATISLAYVSAAGEIAEAKSAAIYFVGSTSPGRHLLPMVVGTRRMLDAADAAFAIINTTGMVHGLGRVLKTHKIEAVQPDVIVALAAGDELNPLIRAHHHYNVLRIRPSSRAVTKTVAEKKARREAAFARYFDDAVAITLPLRKLVIQRSMLFSGEPLEDSRYLHAERVPEGLVVVSTHAPSERERLTVFPAGFEHNLLCGVADHRGTGLGIATMQRIDFKRQTVTLVTPVPRKEIAVLQFGDLYVTPLGEEIGHRRS